MVFAALAASPASAFLCPDRWLYFFGIFPVLSVVEGGSRRLRGFLLLSMAPFALFLWSMHLGNQQAAGNSLRWISAISAGTFFAGVLGPSGISSVLSSFTILPAARRLSDTMLAAGGSVAAAGTSWRAHGGMPFMKRLETTLEEALGAPSAEASHQSPGSLPVTAAALSWCFLLASLAGLLP